MAELTRALEATRRQLMTNAPDVTVLAGGMARLGALTRHLADELRPLRERGNELRALERDVGAMVAEATEFGRERRAAVRRDISGLIDELISRTLTEQNRDRRHAVVRRLESLGEDAEFRKIIETWSRKTRREEAALEKKVSHRIDRRLGDRELRSAAPDLNPSGDARALERATATAAIGVGLAKASNALQKLERFTSGAAGASRLGRFVQLGGPALTVAGAGYSAWSLLSEMRGDAARERKRAEVISAIQRQGVEWAGEVADRDGALARLAELTELLREVQAGAAEESRLAEAAASELAARIGGYQLLADEAATLLDI
jgi:hypothetical protein